MTSDGVPVGVGTGVRVCVGVGVRVRVAVGVNVLVGVRVAVGGPVGVRVAVGLVGVRVRVGVGEAPGVFVRVVGTPIETWTRTAAPTLESAVIVTPATGSVKLLPTWSAPSRNEDVGGVWSRTHEKQPYSPGEV
jgi:hypothetical protein